MANPPWEPYPERKRKLQERARKPKNKHNRGGSKRGRNNPATDSSFSSSSASTDRLPSGRDGETDSIDTWGQDDGQRGPHKEAHIRVRPDDCWCLHEGGCGDEDGCCVEDLPGISVCPCLHRFSGASSVFEVSNTTLILLKKLRTDRVGVARREWTAFAVGVSIEP